MKKGTVVRKKKKERKEESIRVAWRNASVGSGDWLCGLTVWRCPGRVLVRVVGSRTARRGRNLVFS